MKPNLNELKLKKLLSQSDIYEIKSMIMEKKLDKDEYLKIFVKEIYFKLDIRLRDFKHDDREIIKRELLKKLLIKHQDRVDAYDVIDICLMDEDMSQKITSDLASWVNDYMNEKIDEFELIEFFDRIKPKKIDLGVGFGEGQVVNRTDVRDETHVSAHRRKTGVSDEITKEKEESEEIHVDYSYGIERYKSGVLGKIRYAAAALALIAVLAALKTGVLDEFQTRSKKNQTNVESKAEDQKPFSYNEDIDTNKLQEYLREKNSILGEEPHFSTVVSVAREYDLDPVLLFAITGQEQRFVQKDHEYAMQIVNNPFNVYYSWKKYNTTLKDATEIASRTVINRLSLFEDGGDPFVFLNETYAEDKNWHKGVKFFFEEINEYIR